MGTIRYGIKLSSEHYGSNNNMNSTSSSLSIAESVPLKAAMKRNCNENGHEPLASDKSSYNGNDLIATSSNNCDSDNSSSDVNGSCCMNTTKIPLPWIGKSDQMKSSNQGKLSCFFFGLCAMCMEHGQWAWQ